MKETVQEWKQFLKEVWTEVEPKKGRVTWPTTELIYQATKAVIISSIIVGLYVGLVDGIFGWLLRKFFLFG
ncbi:preprotein translocase subunit SecE [Candidatus Riflebacteria bacterium]